MSHSTVTLGLSNPKSPTNVGAVLRAAGCFRADRILYTGIRYDRAAAFCTDTQRQSIKIPLTSVECLLESAPKGAKIVVIELAENAESLANFQHPENAFYIFGPEDGSVKQKVVNKADSVVYIPTHGCLNLAATVNIVLYDRLAKSNLPEGGNELIRKSRDMNNRITVKR
ncbi:MAG: tRNA(Leu) C34 or U34 (ribose-2'-O)-methylase TrmL [Oleispira sp.]|jgi:tRNA(Leu) C34 or U34 (ribose-2'-O)-methylase TrmL